MTFVFWKRQRSWTPDKYEYIFKCDYTDKNKGFVVLISVIIRIAFGIIAYIELGNSFLFPMQIYHTFPCPIYAIITNTVSLVGFYWNHKPLAGGRRLGEDRQKVELTQVFEKCDQIRDFDVCHGF